MRLALACSAAFLVIMDATIVAIALPAIQADLGFTSAALPWVVNAYTLAFAGFLLLGGRVADRMGPRSALLSGLVVFGAATLVGGLATSAPVLLTARAVQGVGGAVLLPASLATVAAIHPPGPERTRGLATWSAVGAVGATAGSILGGVLTEWAGWRWVLLVAVGPVAVAAVLTVRLPGRPREAPRPRPDLLGAVLVTAGLTGVVDGIMQSVRYGWGAVVVLVPLLGGIATLVVFAWWQGRAHDPLLPHTTWRLPGVLRANAVMFTVGLAFFATPVLLALELQQHAGYSAMRAGLAFVPVGVALIVAGRLAARTTTAWGPRRAAVTGLTVATLGYAGLATGLASGWSFPVAVGVPGVLVGLGIGAAFTPITVAATSGVPAGSAGLAGGLLNTTRQLAGALGLAGLSAVALAAGYPVALGWACGCTALAAVFAAILLRPS